MSKSKQIVKLLWFLWNEDLEERRSIKKSLKRVQIHVELIEFQKLLF